MNTGDRLPPRLISMSWYCVSPLQVKDQMYLLDVFQLIDTKSDGYITSDELFRAFRIVGSEVELDTLDSWLTSCTPRRRPGKASCIYSYGLEVFSMLHSFPAFVAVFLFGLIVSCWFLFRSWTVEKC